MSEPRTAERLVLWEISCVSSYYDHDAAAPGTVRISERIHLLASDAEQARQRADALVGKVKAAYRRHGARTWSVEVNMGSLASFFRERQLRRDGMRSMQ